MQRTILVTFAAAFYAMSPLDAQTAEQVAAYGGIMLTPVGGLPPILTNTLIQQMQNGAAVALRVGHLSSGNLSSTVNAFGVTGIIPAGLGSTLSFTGGALVPDCNGCSTRLMLGAGGDYRIFSSALGSYASSPLFTASIDGELGYAKDNPVTYFSGYVGAPIALVQRGTGMQFVPFLTPGFGFAQASASGTSTTGSFSLIGGGVGIYNKASNVMLNAGFQYPFVTNGQSQIGFVLTLGGH
ncbi:MAG TPA: hypothetical protein VIV65_00850 [Gemmatimonadaceae bacterium]